MSKLNDYNKENLRREDFHVIKNSKYSSIYFKSKNVFIPIELDKLDLLEEELLDKKERVLSEDLCKIINQEPKLNFLSAKDFIFKNKIDVLEIIIQTVNVLPDMKVFLFFRMEIYFLVMHLFKKIKNFSLLI